MEVGCVVRCNQKEQEKQLEAQRERERIGRAVKQNVTTLFARRVYKPQRDESHSAQHLPIKRVYTIHATILIN